MPPLAAMPPLPSVTTPAPVPSTTGRRGHATSCDMRRVVTDGSPTGPQAASWPLAAMRRWARSLILPLSRPHHASSSSRTSSPGPWAASRASCARYGHVSRGCASTPPSLLCCSAECGADHSPRRPHSEVRLPAAPNAKCRRVMSALVAILVRCAADSTARLVAHRRQRPEVVRRIAADGGSFPTYAEDDCGTPLKRANLGRKALDMYRRHSRSWSFPHRVHPPQ